MKLAAFLSVLFLIAAFMVKVFSLEQVSLLLPFFTFLVLFLGVLSILINIQSLSFRNVLDNFNQKIWMTCLLGLFYTILFFAINLALKEKINLQNFLAWLQLGLEKPWIYFYVAGLFFTLNSLIIISTRKVIIILYRIRNMKK